MGWSKSDWFGLWTSLAVSGGFAVAWGTYRIARRQAVISAPVLQSPRATGKAGHPKHLIHLDIEPPNHTRWRIAEVRIKRPKGARIGSHIEGNIQHGYLTAVTDSKRVSFPPHIHTANFVADQVGPATLELEVTVALRTDPKVTSRLTTHARIPA